MTDFCREVSLAAGEPLAGSAAHTRVWIVLEVREPWEKKHLPGASLAPEVEARIERWLEDIPESRLQFIRRPGEAHGPLRFMIARSDVEEPWTLGFQLSTYTQLLDLDVPDILRTGIHVEGHRLREPLYLVCCHGKRDRCCAKFGVALHEEVRAACPDRTFQTTHLGGHRFAATMAVLPWGICYGRLDAQEGGLVVEAHEGGEVYEPSRMRGRSAYEPALQAAEIEARLRSDDRSLAGPALRGVERDGETVRARFDIGVIEVAAATIPGERATSCGDDPKPIEALRVVR